MAEHSRHPRAQKAADEPEKAPADLLPEPEKVEDVDAEAEAVLAKARVLTRPEPAPGARKPDFPYVPSSKQVEEKRRERFGKGNAGGSTRLDINPTNLHTTIRYFDRHGNPLD